MITVYAAVVGRLERRAWVQHNGHIATLVLIVVLIAGIEGCLRTRVYGGSKGEICNNRLGRYVRIGAEAQLVA